MGARVGEFLSLHISPIHREKPTELVDPRISATNTMRDTIACL